MGNVQLLELRIVVKLQVKRYILLGTPKYRSVHRIIKKETYSKQLRSIHIIKNRREVSARGDLST